MFKIHDYVLKSQSTEIPYAGFFYKVYIDFVPLAPYPCQFSRTGTLLGFFFSWDRVGSSILFSMVTAPICLLTNCTQSFLFLHILANTFLFWKSFSQGWGDISQSWSVFPWLVMLSLFSCICLPFVWLLLRNVYSVLLPHLSLVTFFLLLSCTGSLTGV